MIALGNCLQVRAYKFWEGQCPIQLKRHISQSSLVKTFEISSGNHPHQVNQRRSRTTRERSLVLLYTSTKLPSTRRGCFCIGLQRLTHDGTDAASHASASGTQ